MKSLFTLALLLTSSMAVADTLPPTIPEPSTLALLGLGAVALAFAKYRK